MAKTAPNTGGAERGGEVEPFHPIAQNEPKLANTESLTYKEINQSFAAC